jgi:hypothetical protein
MNEMMSEKTEPRGRVVDSPASYSRGLFKSQLGDRLSWLRIFVIFLSSAIKMTGYFDTSLNYVATDFFYILSNS